MLERIKEALDFVGYLDYTQIIWFNPTYEHKIIIKYLKQAGAELFQTQVELG